MLDILNVISKVLVSLLIVINVFSNDEPGKKSERWLFIIVILLLNILSTIM